MKLATRIVLIAGAVIGLAACAGPYGEPIEQPPEPPTATPPPAAPTSTPPGLSSGGPTDVTLSGAEDLTLHGTFTPGSSPAPAVLLLHMYRFDRTSWQGFADSLAQAGIASLAIDLRGHGQTGSSENWTLAQQDIAAAVAWLRAHPGVDPNHVGLAGASIGANLSLTHAATDPDQVDAAALLSPGLDYFGVRLDGLAGQASGVDLFLAAAEADAYSAQTVQALAQQRSDATTAFFPGPAHGTDMFAAHPELSEMLVEFFLQGFAD